MVLQVGCQRRGTVNDTVVMTRDVFQGETLEQTKTEHLSITVGDLTFDGFPFLFKIVKGPVKTS